MAMVSIALIALLAAAPPPIPQVVDADAMAWLYAPRAGASLVALDRGGFADLAGLLLPDDVRKALGAAPDSEMLVASFRASTPGQADVALWLDAGAAEKASVEMMERWLEQLGFEGGERRTENGLGLRSFTGASGEMTVFSGQGRCGWSSDASRAARALTVAKTPLAEHATWAATPADADLRGRIDVQRFYGLLARTSRGPKLAGQIRRLGLDSLQSIDVVARLSGKRVRTELRVHLPEPWRDLPAALGPAVAPVRPSMVPRDATGFARVSVEPADLWYVAEKLYGYERAMEQSLVRAQLDSVERRLGKSFTEDALGHDPRVWTTWSTSQGRVLVAEVADAKLAATLLSAYAEVLPTFFPDLSVSRHEVKKRQVLELSVRGRSLVALGFNGSAVVVASDRAQVTRAMASAGGRAKSLGSKPVVAHGEGTALLAPLWNALPAAARERLGRQNASWQLRAGNGALVIDAELRAK